LLLLSKGIPAHPQVQQLEAETLKQKYSNALVEQLRLQEQVMVRDRIIEERGCFPLYHYDQRVSSLRKAVVHWYRQAEQQCLRMRQACRNLKLGITHEVEDMRQLTIRQLEAAQRQLAAFLEEHTSKQPKEREKRPKASTESVKGSGKDISSKAETKKYR
jgi:hypothetical protein